MPNQIYVNLIIALFRNNSSEKFVSVFVRASFGNQPKPARDSKYVSINWKGGPIESEQQCAGNGLRPDAFEAREKLLCCVQRRAFEK